MIKGKWLSELENREKTSQRSKQMILDGIHPFLNPENRQKRIAGVKNSIKIKNIMTENNPMTRIVCQICNFSTNRYKMKNHICIGENNV
jgi:hypothetical protein